MLYDSRCAFDTKVTVFPKRRKLRQSKTRNGTNEKKKQFAIFPLITNDRCRSDSIVVRAAVQKGENAIELYSGRKM